MGSFWLWGWWFFLTLPDRLSCPLFIYMVHFEFESTHNPMGESFIRWFNRTWRFHYLQITPITRINKK